MNLDNINLLLKFAKEYGHKTIRVIGVSDTEHQICAFLFGHSGVSQDDVSNAIRFDRTTVARALFSLENKGFILRCQNPENRRKNLLYLTDKGKNNIAEVVAVYDQWVNNISSCLTPDEKEHFDEYCSRLVSAAKKLKEQENEDMCN